jgi:hypothetical protein
MISRCYRLRKPKRMALLLTFRSRKLLALPCKPCKSKAIQTFKHSQNFYSALKLCLNLAWNLCKFTENKVHLLVLCKFSGSKPEVSNSFLTIGLSSNQTRYSWSPWNLGSIWCDLNEIQNLVKIENFPEL